MVFLVGFMASGKSVVGRALARRLGLACRDTDREIERGARRSVSRLFADLGEEAFRRLEDAELEKACRWPGVVSVGGGAVKRPENVSLMRAAGVVVHLEVPLPTLYERARESGFSKRPLLALDPQGPKAAMRRLMAERGPLYRKARHLAVDGRGPVDAVAGRVHRTLAAHGFLMERA